MAKGDNMKLTSPERIKEIDRYAIEVLNNSAEELMKRSALAVCERVFLALAPASSAVILAGGGNNGGDGYAAAIILSEKYNVTVFDLTEEGPKTPAALFYCGKCRELAEVGGLTLKKYLPNEENERCVKDADLIVEAALGAGAKFPPNQKLLDICRLISSSRAYKISVDIPLGINGGTGEAHKDTPVFDETVSLCFAKVGLYSYPARRFCGKITNYTLGLNSAEIEEIAGNKYTLTDFSAAKALMPKRDTAGHKGTFGKLVLAVGSEAYKGAARLALEAALRSGVGYTVWLGEESELCSLLSEFPEAIYKKRPSFREMKSEDIEKILTECKGSAVLLGSGAGRSENLKILAEKLMAEEGPPIVLDADAINSLSENPQGAVEILKASKRKVILTPHPLEFARLTGKTCEQINQSRLTEAENFARESRTVVVLKGAATVVTDGEKTYINSSGSTALAKAGSGDVLAGALSSLVASAYGSSPLVELAALAVFAHGTAADRLEEEYSVLGVTPSDLPKEIAKVYSSLQNS